MGIVRTTYIIDGNGKITHVFPKVKVDGHIQEVLAALKGEECPGVRQLAAAFVQGSLLAVQHRDSPDFSTRAGKGGVLAPPQRSHGNRGHSPLKRLGFRA